VIDAHSGLCVNQSLTSSFESARTGKNQNANNNDGFENDDANDGRFGYEYAEYHDDGATLHYDDGENGWRYENDVFFNRSNGRQHDAKSGDYDGRWNDIHVYDDEWYDGHEQQHDDGNVQNGNDHRRHDDDLYFGRRNDVWDDSIVL
jgi:hypothetical protein